MEPVTDKEIHKAFNYHKELLTKYDDQNNRSRKMVLFYAVECGLKALFMRKNKLRHTSSIANDLEKSVFSFQHKLVALMKEMNLNFQNLKKAMACDKSQVELDELHQAWRYGKKLDCDDELRCTEELTKILMELEKKL